MKPTSRVKSQQKTIVTYYWMDDSSWCASVSDTESLVLDSGEEVKLTESTESLWDNNESQSSVEHLSRPETVCSHED